MMIVAFRNPRISTGLPGLAGNALSPRYFTMMGRGRKVMGFYYDARRIPVARWPPHHALTNAYAALHTKRSWRACCFGEKYMPSNVSINSSDQSMDHRRASTLAIANHGRGRPGTRNGVLRIHQIRVPRKLDKGILPGSAGVLQ